MKHNRILFIVIFIVITNLNLKAQYCTSSSNSCSWEYISNVTCGSINNSTACAGYGNYTSLLSTNMALGSTQTISVTNGQYSSGDYVDVWIDYNHNGVFTDAGEQVDHVAQTGATTITNFTVPITAAFGPTTMRVCISYSSGTSPCGTIQYGEYEDYTVNLTYCTVGSNSCSWEYISNVTLGSINNSTSCAGYGNYTSMSTNLSLGSTQTISVTNGQYYSGDYVDVWIDYNHNGFYTDAGEQVVHVAQTTAITTASYTVPLTATFEQTTMRVSISYSSGASPCGTIQYGEYEDYTINKPCLPPIIIATPSTICNGSSTSLSATGAISYSWSNSSTGTPVTVSPTSDRKSVV